MVAASTPYAQSVSVAVHDGRPPQDGRISIMIRKSPLDVRVSTLPTVLGEKVVMRLLDDEALRPGPDHQVSQFFTGQLGANGEPSWFNRSSG